MTPVERTEYRTWALGPVHSTIAVFLSVIAMFFICGDGKTVFNNDECMNTVRYLHVWCLNHTCGYFISDLFYSYFIVGGTSAIDY